MNPRRRFPKLAKEPLLTSRLRGNPENRLWAKALDVALGSLVSLLSGMVSPWLPWVVVPFYWSQLDRMGRGQSPGKWLLGLHTIEGLHGSKVSGIQSLIRNLPCVFLSLAFGFTGWMHVILLGSSALACGMELYFLFRLRTGLRVGDVFANTRVFDYKDEHTQFIEQFLKESDT